MTDPNDLAVAAIAKGRWARAVAARPSARR